MNGSPSHEVPAVNKWVVAGSVGIGAIMGTIDTSIVNVALPHIRGSVGATIEEITWVSTAYMIAMVVVMPLTGFLGSLFGQKQVYMASLLLFIVGSALCGTAHTLVGLVACRALQGLGAGSLQPTQQAILRQTFPLREQGMAMAVFGVVVMVGPAIGPTLGGWITDNYSWQWIFFINIPIGILGLMMVLEFVHEPADIRHANRLRAEAQKGKVDWIGIALIAVGISALQYLLEEGQSKDWFQSGAIRACFAVACVFLIAFVIREITAPAPAVNLRLFLDRTFAVSTAIGGVMFALLMGSMFLLPLFMQELLGYDAMQSGIALLPRSLVMMMFMPIVGRLYDRVQPAILVGVGVILFLVGSVQLSHVTLVTSFGDIVVPMIVSGVGFACLFAPLTTAALSTMPRSHLADAAGLNSFVRQIGGSIGLTVSASLLTRYSTVARAGIATHVTLLRPEVAGRLAQMRGMATGLVGPTAAARAVLGILTGKVYAQAAVLAFEKVFLVQGVAFLVILPALWFLRVPRGHDHDGPVASTE